LLLPLLNNGYLCCFLVKPGKIRPQVEKGKNVNQTIIKHIAIKHQANRGGARTLRKVETVREFAYDVFSHRRAAGFL